MPTMTAAAFQALHSGKPTKRARGRHKPGEMNRLEASYADHLTACKAAGVVDWFSFEAVTLKLAHDCRLTVDFFVMLTDGTLEAHDTKALRKGKAHFEEDAKIKLRVAAEKFPWPFKAVYRDIDGIWREREF